MASPWVCSAPVSAWTDTNWSVAMPPVVAGGDTNDRRAFGRTINNGGVVETNQGDAWLKLLAHADVDITHKSAISAEISASRGFSLSGAKYGWGATVTSNLHGQLWNDDSLSPVGTYSSVDAHARIVSATTGAVMGGTTYSISNATHEQTTFVDDAKTSSMVLGNGNYRLASDLQGYAAIGDSCTFCGAEANAQFFASASEALSGGSVSDSARYGLHVEAPTFVPLGHLLLQRQALVPLRTENVPTLTPLTFLAFFDVLNDGDSAIRITNLDFNVSEFDETGTNDLLAHLTDTTALTLAAGESRRISKSFVVDARTLNGSIDTPNDLDHLDFVMAGRMGWTDGFQAFNEAVTLPEPASAGLVLSGLLAAWRARKRTRRAA